MYTIGESIEKLKKEIAEKEILISLINEYASDTMDFTEKNYHKLCETPLRGSHMLGEKLEKVFPFLKLTDKKKFINNYVFTLNMNGENFTVKIPCSAKKNITVVIPKLSGGYSLYNEIKQNEEKLAKVNEMLKEKSIIKRANYLMKRYKKPFRLIVYLANYFTKKRYVQRLTEIKTVLEDRQNFFEKKNKENNELAKKYNDTIDYFKTNFLPSMLKWTNRVVVVPYDNGMTCNNEIVYTNDK